MEIGQYGGAGETAALNGERPENASSRSSLDRPDEVLSVIGETGRWQVRQSVLLSLIGVPVAFSILSINFLAPPTEYWCAPPNDQWDPDVWHDTGIPPRQKGMGDGLSQCYAYPSNESSTNVSIISKNTTVACNSWVYNITQDEINIISEWDLVCGREWLQLMAQGVFMLGIAFGVLFWGVVADRFGRRPSLLICTAVTTALCLGNAAVQGINAMFALRFAIGFFGIGAYVAGFVMSMELFGDKWRLLFGIWFCVPMSFGFMIMSLVAFYVRHWRHLQVILSLGGGPLFVALYCLVSESPRWLLSVGRSGEAWQIMKKICIVNGVPNSEKLIPSQAAPVDVQRPREGCWDLLTNGRMLAMTACLFFCWFVNSLVFYGIFLNTADFGGNIYMNTFLLGLVELPAYAICLLVLYRFGRRPAIICSMIGAGISCLLTLTVEKGVYRYDWPRLCLAMLGKLNITASFGAIYIYTAELYPTSVRNTGMALCSVGTRIGGIVAPFLTLLHPGIPVLVFGGTAIVSGLSLLALPETANRILPDTLMDAIR